MSEFATLRPLSRFVDLPWRKEDVRRDAAVTGAVLSQAVREYAERFGHKVDDATFEYGRTGRISSAHALEGSGLRHSTVRDILARQYAGRSLTSRQSHFLAKARAWQEKACWFGQRCLVLANGRDIGSQYYTLR